MNWEPMTAVSEIVGAIALIVTLVYLARPIAMSNKFAEAEAWRLDPAALDEFPGHSGFRLDFVQEQWPFYRRILTSPVVAHLEEEYGLGGHQ